MAKITTRKICQFCLDGILAFFFPIFLFCWMGAALPYSLFFLAWFLGLLLWDGSSFFLFDWGARFLQRVSLEFVLRGKAMYRRLLATCGFTGNWFSYLIYNRSILLGDVLQ